VNAHCRFVSEISEIEPTKLFWTKARGGYWLTMSTIIWNKEIQKQEIKE
jgi:hypothetical protein